MNVREKAPTILTAEGARRKIARVRDALALADDLLVELYEGEAWTALGYADWSALCAGELPELRMLKLRAPARQARARALLEVGASEREIAAATGASPATAHRDALVVTGRGASFEAPAATPPVSVSRADQVVALVAAQGDRGLTVRELCLEAGLHHGQASGALSRVCRQQRVTRTLAYREGCAVYVTRLH